MFVASPLEVRDPAAACRWRPPLRGDGCGRAGQPLRVAFHHPGAAGHGVFRRNLPRAHHSAARVPVEAAKHRLSHRTPLAVAALLRSPLLGSRRAPPQRNGRFQTKTRICLSISAYHPEEWQPAWGSACSRLPPLSAGPGADSVPLAQSARFSRPLYHFSRRRARARSAPWTRTTRSESAWPRSRTTSAAPSAGLSPRRSSPWAQRSCVGQWASTPGLPLPSGLAPPHLPRHLPHRQRQRRHLRLQRLHPRHTLRGGHDTPRPHQRARRGRAGAPSAPRPRRARTRRGARGSRPFGSSCRRLGRSSPTWWHCVAPHARTRPPPGRAHTRVARRTRWQRRRGCSAGTARPSRTLRRCRRRLTTRGRFCVRRWGGGKPSRGGRPWMAGARRAMPRGPVPAARAKARPRAAEGGRVRPWSGGDSTAPRPTWSRTASTARSTSWPSSSRCCWLRCSCGAL